MRFLLFIVIFSVFSCSSLKINRNLNEEINGNYNENQSPIKSNIEKKQIHKHANIDLKKDTFYTNKIYKKHKKNLRLERKINSTKQTIAQNTLQNKSLKNKITEKGYDKYYSDYLKLTKINYNDSILGSEIYKKNKKHFKRLKRLENNLTKNIQETETLQSRYIQKEFVNENIEKHKSNIIDSLSIRYKDNAYNQNKLYDTISSVSNSQILKNSDGILKNEHDDLLSNLDIEKSDYSNPFKNEFDANDVYVTTIQAEVKPYLDSIKRNIKHRQNTIKSKINKEYKTVNLSEVNKKFLPENTFFDGIIGYTKTNESNILSISPNIGYEISKRYALGFGLNTKLNIDKTEKLSMAVGYKIFGKVNLFEGKVKTISEYNIYHANLSYIDKENNYFDGKLRNEFLCGLEFCFGKMQNSALSLSLLYNFNNTNNNFQISSPWLARFGIQLF